MHHPWRQLRHLAEWTLHFADLEVGLWGTTCHRTRTITLARGLLQAERRCTLAHELEHVDRGEAPAEPTLAAKEELAVEKAMARKMVDIRALGEAMAWSENLDEIADELWVDRDTVLTRLNNLHPAERAYLHRRLDD